MGETRRLIKNTGIIAIGGMATKLVQFLLLPLYTAILSTAEYGTVDYLNVIALFCVPVVSLLMDEALFRFLIDCRTDDERSRAVTVSCLLLAAGCVLFCLAMVAVAAIWHPAGIGWVAGLVIAGALLQMMSAVLRGFGRTGSYAVMNFLASFTMIVLNVLFIAVFRWGVTGMLSATVIAQGGVAVVFVVHERIWRYVDVGSFNRAYAFRLLRYSIPLIPNKVSWTIMNMSSRLVIMSFLGAPAAGLFAVAYKFPNVMDQIYGFFYMSWKESSARALNGGENEVAFYDRVHGALSRFMMSVVLIMTSLMPFVYMLLIDDSYAEGMLYVPILLMATFFSNMSGFYGGIFTAHKDTRIMGTTTIVSAALCLALNFACIPTFGLYGASISTLVSTYAVNAYRKRKVCAYASMEADVSWIVVSALAVLVTFGCFYASVYSGFALASFIGVAAALIYGLWANHKVLFQAIRMILRTARRMG